MTKCSTQRHLATFILQPAFDILTAQHQWYYQRSSGTKCAIIAGFARPRPNPISRDRGNAYMWRI